VCGSVEAFFSPLRVSEFRRSNIQNDAWHAGDITLLYEGALDWLLYIEGLNVL
jgi:hypothetical protein